MQSDHRPSISSIIVFQFASEIRVVGSFWNTIAQESRLGKRKYSHFICPAPCSLLCACLALPRLAQKMAVLLRQETKNKKISMGRARVRRRQIVKTIVRNTLHVASHHLYRRCTSKPLSPYVRPSLLCSRGPFQAEHVRGHRRRTQDTLLYNPLFFSNLGEN